MTAPATTSRSPRTAAPDLAAPQGPFDGGRACADAVLAWQQEVLRFAARRWEADLELSVALAGCRDLGDLVAVQQDWLSSAFRDYTDEGSRLARIAEQVLREGTSQGLRVVEETVQDTVGDGARLMQESGQLLE